MQLQAGYILQPVRDALNAYAKSNDKKHELEGLLRSLCTFEIETLIELKTPKDPCSLLAVANNIITRGLPTLPSTKIEEFFSDILKLTQKKESSGNGKIEFTILEENEISNVGYSIFEKLHTIDPRKTRRHQYLKTQELDSKFEENFLLKLIPEEHSYLSQILEKQRMRSSINRDKNNNGRVDFSLEIPYDIYKTKINRYKAQIQIKHNKTYIIEIDGRKYHTDLLDNIKDSMIAQMPNNINHITQENVFNDIERLITKLTQEDYLLRIAKNYLDDDYLTSNITALSLAPFGIARIQCVLLQYLMAKYPYNSKESTLKIAIIERDVPVSRIAIDDLVELINTLNKLSQEEIYIPPIELQVFTTQEFLNHPLHNGERVCLANNLTIDKYDLVIDIAMMRRKSIFNDDLYPTDKVIIIRNSHYVHYETVSGVISAPPILYKPVVTQIQNEIYEPVEQISNLLKKLLNDIFRKQEFRVGQLPIFNRALQLKSVIGLLPTGGGKSLTYQLAALLQPGITVVIDPIRSLMIDQYNGLKENNIDKCEYINSTLTTAERSYNQNILLSNGILQFLFVSPERFVIEEFRKALENAKINGHYIAYAVIDEVHCVSEWGHDFRTPYLNLGENAQKYCPTYKGTTVPLFGLTATASFDVLADIERELNIKENDGNAVIRFENTVRDEINYHIQEASLPSLEYPDMFSLRKAIGDVKHEKIFNTIANKESVLDKFNRTSALHKIIEHSYKNYLPISTRQELEQKFSTEREAIEYYINSKIQQIQVAEGLFSISEENKEYTYNYGIIVFTPHRKGPLGIKEGIYDNTKYINIKTENNKSVHYFQSERSGYFMGSGDDAESDRVDEESFEHLYSFKENEESLMIATKAFGMGIDKPNIRMTIHINVPQSIESFVQEAGRAGRDGKVSTSIILFNNDYCKITSLKKEHKPIHLDRDVLLYFHKNSFKGQVKERVMIYELRNSVTFPCLTNIQMLTEEINDLFKTDDFQFTIKLGGANHHNRVFINTDSGVGVGYVYLDTHTTGIYNNLGNDTLCYELTDWLKKKLPFSEYRNIEEIKVWLKKTFVNHQDQIGLEKMLSKMKIGETNSLYIPFTNRFYSKDENSQEFTEHLEKVMSTSGIIQICAEQNISRSNIANFLKVAVFNGHGYEEFIESLKILNTQLKEKLLNLEDPQSLQLQMAYFAPRSVNDTAKAIYRLVSIGIIDTYTIDYQNKLYTVQFTKKTDEEYYRLLEELISRYTSRNMAKKEIDQLKHASQNEIKSGKATVISKCLEYLTNFIYSKIKEKRLQAIDDMIKLCQTSMNIKDPLEQNKYIKDEIYYYFNAKYSRRNFKESTVNGDFNASMPDDLDANLPIRSTIHKYIDLVNNVETGEFISNIKHLRGSTMRMLRSNPDMPQFRILKSFALFILADTIRELIHEAKHEVVKGLVDWKYNENRDLDIDSFINDFQKMVALHVVNYNVEEVFSDIEDHYLALYYSTWIGNFNNRFLNQPS